MDERGKLTSCSVVASTGSPQLASKACDKVRRSIGFKPAIEHGRPVRRTTTQRILFHPPLNVPKAAPIAPLTARAGSADGWLASADYPANALRLGMEGSTVITWDVTETGAAENCRVAASSGFSDLDQTACDAVTQRGRFPPATDPSGKPVRSTRSQRVQWRMHR